MWYGSLDVSNSFYNVPLRKSDRNYTAFCTKSNTYRFCRMPQGFCNSSSIFQRLMNMVLRGLTFVSCLCYLDDVVVFAPSLEQYLVNLETVLVRIREAGLKLKPKKCKILSRTIRFLGFNISGDGVSVCMDKIEAVQSWKFPKTLTEVRSFVGLCNYYRQYIPGYANISTSLTDMTKKGAPVCETAKTREAFDTLKERLTSAPILALPRDDCPYVVDCDASNVACAAVLSQWQDGVLRVIYYASRTFNDAERNYCITRRELLGVLFALKHFRVYLLGRRFTLRTDHHALTHLQSVRDPFPQQARYLDDISQFDFECVYRPGQYHCNADALTRRPPCEIGMPYGTACKQCNRRVTGRCSAKLAVVRTRRQRAAEAAAEVSTLPVVALSVDDSPMDEPIPIDEVSRQTPAVSQSVPETRRKATNKGKNIHGLRIPDPPQSLQLWTPEYLRECQRRDVDISPAVGWCEAGALPAWSTVKGTSPFVRALFRQFESLVLFDGILYRTFVGVDGKPLRYQLVMPACLKNQFLSAVHADVAAHLKFDKCLPLVQDRAWWHTYRSDLETFILCCDKCSAFSHRKNLQHQANLRPTVIGAPCERYSIDLCGPFVMSNGYHYVFTAVDVFSRFLVAVPLRDKTAECVARALFEHVILEHGIPFEILSDRGGEFLADVTQELMLILGIHSIKTTSYAPATNGIGERTHRTLNSMFAKCVCDSQRDWSYLVKYICFSYNNTVCRSTGFTPFMVHTGRMANWRVDVLLGDANRGNLSVSDYTREVVSRIQYVQQLVREELDSTNKVMSEWYNRRVHAAGFEIGDRVRVFNPRRYPQRSPKWQLFYSTVAMVVEKVNESLYVVKFDRNNKRAAVHVDKLKIFKEPLV